MHLPCFHQHSCSHPTVPWSPGTSLDTSVNPHPRVQEQLWKWCLTNPQLRRRAGSVARPAQRPSFPTPCYSLPVSSKQGGHLPCHTPAVTPFQNNQRVEHGLINNRAPSVAPAGAQAVPGETAAGDNGIWVFAVKFFPSA